MDKINDSSQGSKAEPDETINLTLDRSDLLEFDGRQRSGTFN